MDSQKVLKEELLIRLDDMEESQLHEVLDFADFLKARKRGIEDPILRVAGCLSGSPLSAEEIEKELYGEDNLNAWTDLHGYMGLDRIGTPQESAPL
jgi:hypothetical protein